MKKSAIATFLAILFTLNLSGQTDISWFDIDESIGYKSELARLDKRLSEKYNAAWRTHDYISIAHALYDRMRIRDLRTEDTLYFHNSAFIDSLLFQQSTPKALQALLHLIQAERLVAYQGKRLRFNSARYETPALP